MLILKSLFNFRPWRRTPRERDESSIAKQEEASSANTKDARAQTETVSENTEDSPHYPPSDRGIPGEPVERVIGKQKELISRIKRAAGVQPEIFARHYEPAIGNIAAYIHLLPATDSESFVGPGGLFRFALEVGLHALQGAQAGVFPQVGSVDKRSAMTPRWELATFLAGMCQQLYLPLANMVVTDRANNEWPQLLMPLSQWVEENNVSRYFVRWLNDDTRGEVGSTQRARAHVPLQQSLATYLTNRIVPFEVLQYIAQDNKVILPFMTGAISGGEVSAVENPIRKIVDPMRSRVLQQDRLRRSTNYGRYALGVQMEPHLLDAMRRLVRAGKWTPNAKGSRVWVGKDGTFVVWGAASKDIVAMLTADAFVGIPQDPDTLADILLNCGILLYGKAQSRYWTIALPDSGAVIDNAVRLAIDNIIFPEGMTADIEKLKSVSLVVDGATESKAEAAGKNHSDLATKGDGTTPEGTTRRRKVEKQLPPHETDEKATKPEPAPEALKKQVAENARSLDLFQQDTHSEALGSAQEAPTEKAKRRVTKSEVASPAKMEPSSDVVPNEINAVESPDKPSQSQPVDEVSEVNDKLLVQLERESSWVIKQIARGVVTGKLCGVVKFTEHGVAISDAELTAHGIPPENLLNDMISRNWLWIDPKKPLRKLHKVAHGEESLNCMIIKGPVARCLGFDWKPSTEAET